MKRLVIYATGIGLVAGVIYWLYNKMKSNNVDMKSVDNKGGEVEPASQEETAFQNSNVVNEMYHAKSESVQDIYERHSEAGEIMKDAYCNIMEDFVEDFSSENTVNDKNKDVVIDVDDISIIKELDSISDELDDLLK